MNKQHIFVWDPISSKSSSVYNYLVKKVNERDLGEHIEIYRSSYIGMTSATPIIRCLPKDVIYTKFEQEDLGEIFESIVANEIAERFVCRYDDKLAPVEERDKHSKQFKIVLRNVGYLDPESIDEYISRGGYKALEKALFELNPDKVIKEVKDSGLRGRGGAGFSTGMKWELTRKEPGEEKFVICNADEGDPGAYMDRAVLEGDPHTIVEGMTIGAYAVGCKEGFIYCRAEYPLAIERLEKAIADAKKYGLLGNNILGSDFSFNLELRW